jgi:hypothetical protein
VEGAECTLRSTGAKARGLESKPETAKRQSGKTATGTPTGAPKDWDDRQRGESASGLSRSRDGVNLRGRSVGKV